MTELLLKSSLKSQSVLPYVSFDNIATLLCNLCLQALDDLNFSHLLLN